MRTGAQACARARSGVVRSLRSLVVAAPLIRDRAWVVSRLDAGATVTAIAKEAGVSRQTAQTWLARHGVRGRPVAKRRPSATRLRALYAEHGTITAVAQVLDVAPSTAHRWLIDAGARLAAQGPNRRLQRPSDLAELRHRRAAGATLDELAAHFGVSRSTIRRRLIDLAPP